MSSFGGASGPPGRSPEPLWQLIQFKKIQAFNDANEAGERALSCWPVIELPPGEDAGYRVWIAVVTFNVHAHFPMAKDKCFLRIEGQPRTAWWEATRIQNPTATIATENETHSSFTTLRVKVPRALNDERQPPFAPLEMTKDPEDGALRPIFSVHKMLRASLRLKIKSTPQLDDQIERKYVPDPSWKFHNPKHYHEIFQYGAEQDFEFEAAGIRSFNRESVYKCWLLLCDTSNDELPRPGSKGVTRQQCVLIVSVPKMSEEFPRVGDLCDLAFARHMPPLGKDADTTKDNEKLKRRGLKYLGGTRLDNPYDKFRLDEGSQFGSSWNNYCTLKVSVYKESSADYSPLDDFACKLDWNTINRNEGRQKPRITLDLASSFEAHVLLRISTTTKNVELDALRRAMEAPADSRIGRAVAYIRTFESSADSFSLLQEFPHMQTDQDLPENLSASIQSLDEAQKHAYKTILSNLPARVGILPAAAGTGKTELLLTISALALSPPEETQTACGPILLILEANRPANAAATRVVQYFRGLDRSDLRIIRAYNFNYEGMWGARKYLKPDSDDTSSADHFEKTFEQHLPDHMPQLRRGRKGECLAPNLREAAQQYLRDRKNDFPVMSALLKVERPEDIERGNFDEDNVLEEWGALFSRVLGETDFVITTPVGAAKLRPYFRPKLVLCDEAARMRELGTLVAIANFPSAEAFLFTGTVEMTKPYLASHGSEQWNPCAETLRTSMMARYVGAVPDTPRLSLNHQAYGNLHTLSSDLFWDGTLDSALPSNERFPPSTMHLLQYCRNLASNQTLKISAQQTEMDPEQFLLPGGQGERLHRQVQVQTATADVVQGHSADVVILDLVNFEITPHVADPNRLCSALTRSIQCELVIMDRGMLWEREGPGRRDFGYIGPHIRLLHEHCKSHGQVIDVDPVDDSHVKKGYSLHREDPPSGLDQSAVPRQLPALPPNLDLPQDDKSADATPAAAVPNLPTSEGGDDVGDAEDMFGLAEKFGFEMVRKAMEMGLKLSADGVEEK